MACDLQRYLPAFAVCFRRFSPSDGLFTDCGVIYTGSDLDFEVSGGSDPGGPAG
jgi:hypothetical protein